MTPPHTRSGQKIRSPWATDSYKSDPDVQKQNGEAQRAENPESIRHRLLPAPDKEAVPIPEKQRYPEKHLSIGPMDFFQLLQQGLFPESPEKYQKDKAFFPGTADSVPGRKAPGVPQARQFPRADSAAGSLSPEAGSWQAGSLSDPEGQTDSAQDRCIPDPEAVKVQRRRAAGFFDGDPDQVGIHLRNLCRGYYRDSLIFFSPSLGIIVGKRQKADRGGQQITQGLASLAAAKYDDLHEKFPL